MKRWFHYLFPDLLQQLWTALDKELTSLPAHGCCSLVIHHLRLSSCVFLPCIHLTCSCNKITFDSTLFSSHARKSSRESYSLYSSQTLQRFYWVGLSTTTGETNFLLTPSMSENTLYPAELPIPGTPYQNNKLLADMEHHDWVCYYIRK